MPSKMHSSAIFVLALVASAASVLSAPVVVRDATSIGNQRRDPDGLVARSLENSNKRAIICDDRCKAQRISALLGRDGFKELLSRIDTTDSVARSLEESTRRAIVYDDRCKTQRISALLGGDDFKELLARGDDTDASGAFSFGKFISQILRRE